MSQPRTHESTNLFLLTQWAAQANFIMQSQKYASYLHSQNSLHLLSGANKSAFHVVYVNMELEVLQSTLTYFLALSPAICLIISTSFRRFS